MSSRGLLLCYLSWTALAVAVTEYEAIQPFPVTGITTGINNLTGERPARQDINVLQETGGPAWDLYMLGLSKFQNQSENDPNSYFGIASIHGRPFVPWNGVDCPEGSSCPDMTGYCPHGFSAWHRPYLVLYEQVLGDHVQAVASEYTGTNASAYKAAAQTLRHPYWDWSKKSDVPNAATQRRVTVHGPEGLVNIPNPLYSYRWQRFPLNNASNYFPVDGPVDCWSYNETKRQPDRNGIDQFSLINEKLSAQGLKDKVYRVFTSANDFETMASTAGNGASFEDPHNGVHNAVGAVMLDSSYSSYDPLFWLHHANIDRLVAMWQATHYNNTYQTKNSTAGNGLFATPADEPMSAGSPLKPFYKAGGDFHTAKTVASTKAFGYTYPEINDWSMNADETRRSVIAQVNELYSDDAAKKSRITSWAWAKPSWKEYYAQIQVERSELPLPCSINLMLGEHMAGQTSILSMPTSGRTHAEVPLTRALKQIHGRLDAATVIPSLQKSLRIEIRKNDGSLLPVDSIPSLSVEVHDEDVVAPSRIEEFPRYSTPRKWPGVGRAAKTVG